jgi:oligopeptide transport system substrate-binding protein
MTKKVKNYIILLLLLLSLSVVLVFNVSTTPSSPANKRIQVNIGGEPFSLHPSYCQSIDFSTPVLHMLFDGLTRLNKEGIPIPSIAKEIIPSDDFTKFTFHLRDATWSNGDSITAHDFVYSWSKIVDPNTPSPSADQLFVLKNAKAIKQGTKDLEELGVQAIDNKTLCVELEYSTPYFLELTAMPFYLPIHKATDIQDENWAFNANENFVCNGPYLLKKWKHSDYIEVEKNPFYWDKEAVHIDSITVIMVDENTALAMFQSKELDWAGSPTSTILPDALHRLESEENLFILPSTGTHYYFFNTQKPPFDNKNLRKAFALSINRHSIVNNLIQGHQLPATTLVPPSLIHKQKQYFVDKDFSLAKKFLNKGLEELNILKSDLPPITLIYCAWERNEKIAQAIQYQWEKNLGIKVAIQSYERNVFLDKRKNHDYQIASGSWYSTFKDPLSFLELFETNEEEQQPVAWKNSEYNKLLSKVRLTSLLEERHPLLEKAETYLIEEMPLIPIYHNTFAYVKNPKLKNVYLSDLGVIDFKWAVLE